MRPVGCHTMCAMGQYTTICQKLMKIHSALGLTLCEAATATSQGSIDMQNTKQLVSLLAVQQAMQASQLLRLQFLSS